MNSNPIKIKLDEQTNIMMYAENICGEEEKISADKTVDGEPFFRGIKIFCQEIKKSILDHSPTKASVEFSAKMNVESGTLTTLICDSSAEGSIKVCLEWNPK